MNENENVLPKFEVYELRLDHYIGSYRLEDPIIIKTVINNTYQPQPYVINEMIEKLRTYLLSNIRRDE